MQNGNDTNSTEILNLTQTALSEFESLPLDGSARRALRIAQVRGDGREAWLLRADLRPSGGSNQLRFIEIAALFRDTKYAEIAAADKSLRDIWTDERSVKIPESMKGIVSDDKEVIVGSISDLLEQKRYFESEAAKQKEGIASFTMTERARLSADIIERIRVRIYSYLCRVESELRFSLVANDIMEAYRQRIDSQLAEVASDVLEQFTAAYRRMNEGDVESRSHALASCRRILKAIADIVYPARSEPVTDKTGKVHDVSDEKYINRLWLFIDDHSIGSTIAKSMHATLAEVGARIDRLNKLANKGVHAEVTVGEVEWCVVQTYIFTGEILRLNSENDAS